jgi:hypothetical protein
MMPSSMRSNCRHTRFCGNGLNGLEKCRRQSFGLSCQPLIVFGALAVRTLAWFPDKFEYEDAGLLDWIRVAAYDG